MRRFLGGRQPLWGTGVTSEIAVIFRPRAFNARTEDSRPGPGPPDTDLEVLDAAFWAAFAAASAATWAAKGVDLREPRKPAPPEVARTGRCPGDR